MEQPPPETTIDDAPFQEHPEVGAAGGPGETEPNRSQEGNTPGWDHPHEERCVTREELTEWYNGFTKEDIAQLQELDGDIAELREMLNTFETRPKWKDVANQSELLKTYWLYWDEYEIHEDTLYRIHDDGRGDHLHQLLVPRGMRNSLFELVHSHVTGGHLGYNKCYGRLKERFWWPGCKQDLHTWLQKCQYCGRAKDPTAKRRAPLTQLPVGEPMERIAADICGPFPLTGRNNLYILVIVDYFTKWAEAYPITDMTALTVALCLGQFIARMGCPRQFHSDKGPCFRAEVLQELCAIMQIDKTETTSYRPQSDGLVERFNRTLGDMLTACCRHKIDWDLTLPYVMMAYRATPQESTGLSPNLMMFGRQLRSPLDLQFPPPEMGQEYECTTEYVEWLRNALREAHEVARQFLRKAADRQKRNYSAGGCADAFKVGDWVYVRDHRLKKKKLEMKWKAPHLVLAKQSPVLYKVQASPTAKTEVYHVDNLKMAYGCTTRSWLAPRRKEAATQSNLLEVDAGPAMGPVETSAEPRSH
jgi:transposase InsO family protein